LGERGKQHKSMTVVRDSERNVNKEHKKSLLTTSIYSPKTSQKPKRHKILNRWICSIQRSTSFGAQKSPHKCTSRHSFRRRFQSHHPSLCHRTTPNSQTLQLYQPSSLGGKCTGMTEWLSEPVRNSNHSTTIRRSCDYMWPTDPWQWAMDWPSQHG